MEPGLNGKSFTALKTIAYKTRASAIPLDSVMLILEFSASVSHGEVDNCRFKKYA